MLINWHDPDHVYLVCGKTDLRKGIDRLAMVIAENYGLELYDNSLFLFCGSRNDRFKGLLWDGEGFILLYKRYKRFENGHLSWPRHSSEAKELSARQLDWLLKGLNPLPVRRIKACPTRYLLLNYLCLKSLFFDIITDRSKSVCASSARYSLFSR